jgi:hypothetical protein
VLAYPYRWKREQANNETEGRKPRPVAVGVRIAAKVDGGNDRVILYPITSRRPADVGLSFHRYFNRHAKI